MNELDKKINIFSKTISLIRTNLRSIIFFALALLIFFIIFQFYQYYSNQKILDTSISYNTTKSLNSEQDFLNQMKNLSRKKNFYGILSSLEIINNNLGNKNFEEAFLNYKKILDEKNIENLYKSIISIHSAYSLINNIDNDKIYELLDYYDQSIESFKGFYYEILFLLSINEGDNKKINKLFEQITYDDKISTEIKERVLKINEFEKNK